MLYFLRILKYNLRQKIEKISNIVTFDKIALVDCNNKHFKDWNIICCKKLL